MWTRSFSWGLLLLFSFCLLGLLGCDAEQVGETAEDVSSGVERIMPLVPLPFKWIAYAISGVASAVAGVAFGIKENRGKQAMRRSIQAIGKVIDHGKFSKREEVRKATGVLLELFGSAKTLNNPGIRDDLLLADAVRKNLK